jgi:hypothetical protein
MFDVLVVTAVFVIAFLSAFAYWQDSQLEAKGIKYLIINQNVLLDASADCTNIEKQSIVPS